MHIIVRGFKTRSLVNYLLRVHEPLHEDQQLFKKKKEEQKNFNNRLQQILQRSKDEHMESDFKSALTLKSKNEIIK